MAVTLEEEIVLLYTLYVCGKKPSKTRATHFILSNQFMKERKDDFEKVSTGETRIENRIAWTRQNLKSKGELSMPASGIWAITTQGTLRIEKIAIKSLRWKEPEDELDVFLHKIQWDRFSDDFLNRLKELGKKLEAKNRNNT